MRLVQVLITFYTCPKLSYCGIETIQLCEWEFTKYQNQHKFNIYLNNAIIVCRRVFSETVSSANLHIPRVSRLQPPLTSLWTSRVWWVRRCSCQWTCTSTLQRRIQWRTTGSTSLRTVLYLWYLLMTGQFYTCYTCYRSASIIYSRQ